MARPVGAGGEGRAHAPELLDDHEQVAVHEARDQHERTRHAQLLEPAQDGRERRGRGEQHGADGADRGLGGDRAEHGEARLVDGQRPERVRVTARAHERHEQAHEQDERQHEPRAPPDLPRGDAAAAATAASTSAQPA